MKTPIMWVSITRIVATLMIFVFHYHSIYGIKAVAGLDIVGIALFLFISGYLVYTPTMSFRWLVRKFKQILIPYWFVIIPILLINEVIVYKQTTWVNKLVALVGGSYFIDDPIMVVAWFITVILLFYTFTFLVFINKSITLQILFFTGGIALFMLLGLPYVYIGSFLFGFLMRKNAVNTASKPVNNRLNAILFTIQNFSYSFFLIHGGIIFFFVKILGMEYSLYSFFLCFVCSSIFMIMHKILVDFFYEKMIDKIIRI
jgi:hypothetical protein